MRIAATQWTDLILIWLIGSWHELQVPTLQSLLAVALARKNAGKDLLQVHLHLFNLVTNDKSEKSVLLFFSFHFFFVACWSVLICSFLCQHRSLLLFMCGKRRTPCPDRLVFVKPTQNTALNTMCKGEKKQRKRNEKELRTHAQGKKTTLASVRMAVQTHKEDW